MPRLAKKLLDGSIAYNPLFLFSEVLKPGRFVFCTSIFL